MGKGVYLGLDVGGTHTDAVVVEKGVIRAFAKVITCHADLLSSIRGVLDCVLAEIDPREVQRFNLSTTLSTNAIVEGMIEDVGVLVSAGPGVDPEEYRIGSQYHVLSASIDHRGQEIAPLQEAEIAEALRACREAGIRVYAAVAKFSIRNPTQEQLLQERILPEADFVSLGHKVSGRLNFPRRIHTAYYNGAVWRLYNEFVDAVSSCIAQYGFRCPINMLKADGGTMPLAASREAPVQSILSGPAASVMGILSLCELRGDSIILDIGGTTTDIAVLAEGVPLIEPEGISIDSRPTLVRALKTRSIGVGGDSRIQVQGGEVQVGPVRVGPPMALGGVEPTLTDAFNAAGLAAFGDLQASRAGIQALSVQNGMEPGLLADAAVAQAVKAIKREVERVVQQVNDRPVYTIMELLHGKRIEPSQVYVVGGPAKVFEPLLACSLGCSVVIPEHFEVANAIGAALTRTTLEIELFADTEKRFLFVPNLDLHERIESSYSKEAAERDAKRFLSEYLTRLDVEVRPSDMEIVESYSFNMVKDDGVTARNIRIKCRLRPAVEQ